MKPFSLWHYMILDHDEKLGVYVVRPAEIVSQHKTHLLATKCLYQAAIYHAAPVNIVELRGPSVLDFSRYIKAPRTQSRDVSFARNTHVTVSFHDVLEIRGVE